MSETNELDVVKEAVKELSKDAYQDVIQPTVQPLGQTVGLVPRAIKAALLPLEKWILQREYNLKETEKLLEKKLQEIDPAKIVSPEPYVAVPAIQYISYCMNDADLRELFANLLAKSMIDDVKSYVHPSFLEIIKQLSPDEAKLLRYFSEQRGSSFPTITMWRTNSIGDGIVLYQHFSNIGELAHCVEPFNIQMMFDNLARQGLIEYNESGSSLYRKDLYEPLKTHPFVQGTKRKILSSVSDDYNIIELKEGFIHITELGKRFIDLCVKEQMSN